MRFYLLNTKSEGHLLLPKVAQFLGHFTLTSKLCHFILGHVYLDRVVYCKSMWFYSQNIEPESHAVCMHVAWFLRYSSLESGQGYIELSAVNMDGGYYISVG